MASRALPTILLVTGAATTARCYDLLVPLLQQAGYATEVVALPSCNPTDPEKHTGASDGKELLERHLSPLVEDGKDVVVFAHSFGATSLSGAGHHLSKSERAAQGLVGGIFGLIYISFALVPDGKSQIEYLGGSWPPFVKLNHVCRSHCSIEHNSDLSQPSRGLFVFDPVIDTLFNDVDAKTATELAKGILPHSIRPIETPVWQPLWTDPRLEGRRVMIKTLQDATFPLAAQEMFADGSGVEWEFREVDGGHEAFLTKPKAVADIVVDVIKRWQ